VSLHKIEQEHRQGHAGPRDQNDLPKDHRPNGIRRFTSFARQHQRATPRL
jgi:hypothetical protein